MPLIINISVNERETYFLFPLLFGHFVMGQIQGGRSRGSGLSPFCRHVIERDHQQICIAAFMQDV